DADPAVHHGTRMAMVMAAPPNGVGTVGIWPALRIVSLRVAATPASGGEVTFPFGNYERAILKCVANSQPRAPNRIVEMALASSNEAGSVDTLTLADRLARAHSAGLNVVAAAGNDSGLLGEPASQPGVLAVGAADDVGAICDFSSRGPGLALVAPGCGI